MVTSDLGRVTTDSSTVIEQSTDCGDVRSRTSYNDLFSFDNEFIAIVVTSDLGRVTTT